MPVKHGPSNLPGAVAQTLLEEAREHLRCAEVVTGAPWKIDETAADLIRRLCNRVEDLENRHHADAIAGRPPGVPSSSGGPKRRK
jgi:hypothetical protein